MDFEVWLTDRNAHYPVEKASKFRSQLEKRWMGSLRGDSPGRAAGAFSH